MVDGDLSRRGFLVGAGAAGLGAITAGPGVAGASDSGRHIVGTSTPAATDRARRAAESVYRVLDFGAIGQAVAGRFSEAALEALSRNPNVRYIEEDGTMEAIDQTLPWGIDRIDADVLHDDGATGDGADIAVIDTGIDDDHPDLQANIGDGVAFVGCRGSNCNQDWSDDHDHGTHCAGIAAAVDNDEGVVGVSPEATLHAVKVLDSRGSGSFSDVAAGIEYTADQGWDVGSMSLGASSGSQTVEDACQYASDRGVLLVAAAGNDGPCSDCVGYPAAYDTVVAVSSTDEDDALSSFSSTGPEVELAGPGRAIYSTVIGGYATFSGTSMACPHVSGVGGQLMADGYSNAEARTRLQETAEDIDLSANEQGHGLVDAEAAVLGRDGAPSVSWVSPAEGETVSGTVTIQIAAGDSEDSDDSLDVTYNVDGGTSRSTTFDEETGYYEDSWDSSEVSDGDHSLEATATDADGNIASSSITVTTDNTETPPSVDSLSLSEVETADSDAEFDADWSVSDTDGNLASVELELTDDTDGGTEDTATVSFSGESATDTTRLVAAGDDGSGNGYTVELTVTDTDGNTASDSASATETDESSSPPVVDEYAVTEAGSPNPHAEIAAEWDVRDSDGDLDSVDVEVLDDTGALVDSSSHDVSGSTASGSDEFKIRHADEETFDVTLTVTDAAGNSTSETQTVTS